ncbi:uncharacterized protein At4g00950-like [Lotus japonicus]|uniref:uncharacterized protein At4g00950-like n=1 Tax=Lotus japonicus TaxID=34305 RepID=UPI002588C901|nr:uncharacterized protein At4g00950-like [Lotus japonicus]
MISPVVPDNNNNTDHHHHHFYKPTKLSSRPTTSPELNRTAISVPFMWEEAPGKPRPCHTRSEPTAAEDGLKRTRTLELPPRLLFLEAKDDWASPMTVLDGPYVGRAMSFSSSYRTPREYLNSNFGSSRWSGFRKISKEDEGSFDISESFTATKSKVKKVHSSMSLSKVKSHLWWASIYDSLKQVVPWRGRQETKRKWSSKNDTV